MIQALLAKFAIKRVRRFIARKAKASVKSTTMGVAAGVIALAAWAQANPEVVTAIAGEWAGVVLAVVALAAAVARLRTLGEDEGEE
jgi:hypothetical protein